MSRLLYPKSYAWWEFFHLLEVTNESDSANHKSKGTPSVVWRSGLAEDQLPQTSVFLGLEASFGELYRA